jgi:hypothetical protein
MSKLFACYKVILPVIALMAGPASSEPLNLSKSSFELCLLTVPHENTLKQTQNSILRTIACNTAKARDCQSELNGCLEACINGRPEATCQQACETNYKKCKVAAGCP